jgi:hypothetical protein
MNKKRKLLTVLALAVFGAIILFHYCDPWFHQGQLKFGPGGAWHGGRYDVGSIEPLIADVQMPLFALAVVYAGLFFLFGGKDAEPVPRRSRNWRRVSINGAVIGGLCLFVFGVVAYSVNLATRYDLFTYQLNAVQGIHIGDSRDEVKYRLGYPRWVLGPLGKGPFGSQPVYEVPKIGATPSEFAMPSTTKEEDYDEWLYEEPSSNVRLTVGFNKSGFVESLELYSDPNHPYPGWGAVAGLNSGDSEGEVLRLGQPSRQSLHGPSKMIEYRDIGIAVTLVKGRAYMITIKGPQEKAAVFRRFMRTLP